MLYGDILVKELSPAPTHKRASAWKNGCKYIVFSSNGKEYPKENYTMSHYELKLKLNCAHQSHADCTDTSRTRNLVAADVFHPPPLGTRMFTSASNVPTI